MVIALIVTPDGLPLAYEVMAGNTSDKTTLRDFIKRIETQYGSERVCPEMGAFRTRPVAA